LGLIVAAMSISCGEKKEEKTDNIVAVKLPDGTEIELNKDRLYAESECEVDNVLTSTYRRNWYSINVVFIDDDQKADYEITATDGELTIHAVCEGNDEVDTVYAKTEAVFSTDRIFDFSLDVEFTLALTTDDFLVNEASYLKSPASWPTVRPCALCLLTIRGTPFGWGRLV
jgi:hypothetical protein